MDDATSACSITEAHEVACGIERRIPMAWDLPPLLLRLLLLPFLPSSSFYLLPPLSLGYPRLLRRHPPRVRLPLRTAGAALPLSRHTELPTFTTEGQTPEYPSSRADGSAARGAAGRTTGNSGSGPGPRVVRGRVLANARNVTADNATEFAAKRTTRQKAKRTRRSAAGWTSTS